MKKRTTAFLLTLCIALTLLPGAALAAEPGREFADRHRTEVPEADFRPELLDTSNIVEYPVSDGTISFDPSTGMIVGRTGKITSVEIPSKIAGIPVSGIGQEVFRGCLYLTKVTIPDSVTTIQYGAFRGCSALNSVTIPSSVTTVGRELFRECPQLKTAGPIGSGCNIEFGWSSEISECVFWGCTGLEEVTLPATITKIGEYAFAQCKNLRKIELPSALTRVERGLFEDCSSLSEVTISGEVSSIGFNAFYRCTNLSRLTIPGSVTDIDRTSFEGCTGLTSAGPIGSGCSIEFGWTEELPSFAFHRLTALTSVKIPDGITRIGSNAFRECNGLKSITIPDGVTWIGDYAFSFCEGLETITFPASVQTLSDSAVSWCDNLRYVVILNSEIMISPSGNFGNCENLTDIYFNGGKEAWEKSVTVLYLPESVTVHFNSIGPDEGPDGIRSVAHSGNSVSTVILVRTAGTAYCAFYGENQRLLAVRDAAFTEKTRNLRFSGPAVFSAAKVFLTDGTGTPLYPAKSAP